MLLRRTGDAEAAEDLAQETLLRAFRNLHRYDPTKPIWPWLRAIALNRAASWAAQRRSVASLEGVDRAAESRDLQEVESRETLHSLLLDLTEAQQHALWLRYVEDQDSRKAAATLGLSVAAFKQLLHRARTALRTRLEEHREAVFTPLLLPLRAFRRLVARVSKSDTVGLRVAEALAPAGTAMMALLIVVGSIHVPSARAEQSRESQVITPGSTRAVVHRSSDAPPEGARRGAHVTEARKAALANPANAGRDVAGSAAQGSRKTCTGDAACTSHSDLPGAPGPSSPPGVNDRVSPFVQADTPLGDVCVEDACAVDDPSSEPGGGAGGVVDEIIRDVRILPTD